MSVGEARFELNNAIGWWNCKDVASEQRLDAAIDRLILEVQAAMPCYGQEFYFPRRVCAHSYGPSDWFCPSCTARKQLTEVTA